MPCPDQTTRSSRFGLLFASAFVCAVVALALLILYNTLRLDGGYTPDSLFYIDAARNLLAGRGLVSSMAEFDRLIAADQALPVAFTLWAPLYPLAIAGVASTGMPATAAALVVAIVAYAGVLLATFLLAQRMAGSGAGALAVALVVHMPPLLTAAQTAWSETLGLAFLLLALWLLLRPVQSRTYTGTWAPLAAGILAGLAFDTRYALFPIVAFGPLVYLALGRRTGIRAAAQFTAGALVVIAPVVLRNFTSDGLPSGAGDADNHIAFAENTARISPALGLSLWNNGFLFNFLALLLAAFVAYAIFRRARVMTAPSTMRLWPGAAVLFVWAAVYVAFLLAAQYRVRVDPLNARLLLPMTIVVPPLVAAAIVRLGLSRRVATAFAALFLVVAIYAQANNAHLIFGTRLPPVYDLAGRMPRDGAIAWLARHVQPQDLLIAEDGLDFPLYLGPINTAFFSKAHTPGFHLDAHAVFAYVDRHACNGANVWLVVVNRAGSPISLEVDNRFHAALSAGDAVAHERIKTAAAFDDYRIYTISCEAGAHAD